MTVNITDVNKVNKELKIQSLKAVQFLDLDKCVHCSGFLPRETAEHHRSCVLSLVKQALTDAQLKPSDLDVICFTKG